MKFNWIIKGTWFLSVIRFFYGKNFSLALGIILGMGLANVRSYVVMHTQNDPWCLNEFTDTLYLLWGASSGDFDLDLFFALASFSGEFDLDEPDDPLEDDLDFEDADDDDDDERDLRLGSVTSTSESSLLPASGVMLPSKAESPSIFWKLLHSDMRAGSSDPAPRWTSRKKIRLTLLAWKLTSCCQKMVEFSYYWHFN